MYKYSAILTGKHWSDNEVRALINIWSDEKIQQMLEGATRNKEIFEEIARRLMKSGIDRDWKQCRTKYKNLKYEYRALQKENEHLGNPRRKMRFYDEVDCILRRQPLGPSSWGCESSSLLSGTKTFRGSGVYLSTCNCYINFTKAESVF
uniref:Myb/SANT-like DNA-binding domain-containing protein n=1 Tax=Strix occidentalis caurina TaxID=311401 RepID=A0A8D0EQK4_STROC